MPPVAADHVCWNVLRFVTRTQPKRRRKSSESWRPEPKLLRRRPLLLPHPPTQQRLPRMLRKMMRKLRKQCRSRRSNSSTRPCLVRRRVCIDGRHTRTPADGSVIAADLSGPMSDGYNPIAVEAAWDTWWEAVGVYKPALTADGQPKPEGTFVIPLPPPNVTGALHIGHALTVAVQDCLVRWNRMLGKTVLYTPGYDHAGISTQSVVEKRLYKSTGQTRHDLGREEFLKRVWAWKDDYQIRITSQMRRLGASTDWSRVAFTMDDVSAARTR